MRSGYVAVIGRANAGKSTLINVMVGEKVSIVSPKPQTTRERILGVLTTSDYQIAFIDTPGIYKADNLLNSVISISTGKEPACSYFSARFLGIKLLTKTASKKFFLESSTSSIRT